MKPPKAIKRLTKLLKRIQAVNNIVEDRILSWETKYRMIFSLDFGGKINLLFAKLNLDFKYYDPDTGYEDDTLAFVRALNDMTPKLKSILEMLQKLEGEDVLQISENAS